MENKTSKQYNLINFICFFEHLFQKVRKSLCWNWKKYIYIYIICKVPNLLWYHLKFYLYWEIESHVKYFLYYFFSSYSVCSDTILKFFYLFNYAYKSILRNRIALYIFYFYLYILCAVPQHYNLHYKKIRILN